MALSDALVVMNPELNRIIVDVKDFLESESKIALYTTDRTPEEDDELGVELVEATYAGYARQDVAAEWGAVTEEENGLYTITCTLRTFVPPTSGTQTIHGVMILADYGGYDLRIMAAGRFPTTYIDWESGDDDLKFTVKIKVWSQAHIMAEVVSELP